MLMISAGVLCTTVEFEISSIYVGEHKCINAGNEKILVRTRHRITMAGGRPKKTGVSHNKKSSTSGHVWKKKVPVR